jgi:ribosomal-protein-alanine N-acetyltransferase
VGRLLLDEFVERARRAGATRVHLEVRDGNPAVEMYRQAGFEPAGRRPKYYRGDDGHQFDAITLACDL